MPESFYDSVVIIAFTVVPITLILLQILLSTRKKLILGFIVPLLWTVLGAWILIRGYMEDKDFSFEMLIVFIVGDFILLAILALFKYLKEKKKQAKHTKPIQPIQPKQSKVNRT
ncbi:MAG TPA: hypothetical protein VJZ06_01255 [Mobilitalea sp.]|nr:hypothetical protein [Mobilitalea sp.]